MNNFWTNLWLALIAFALLTSGVEFKKEGGKIEKVYVKQSPWYDYCITVGSDGKHPDATEFCKGVLK